MYDTLLNVITRVLHVLIDGLDMLVTRLQQLVLAFWLLGINEPKISL